MTLSVPIRTLACLAAALVTASPAGAWAQQTADQKPAAAGTATAVDPSRLMTRNLNAAPSVAVPDSAGASPSSMTQSSTNPRRVAPVVTAPVNVPAPVVEPSGEARTGPVAVPVAQPSVAQPPVPLSSAALAALPFTVELPEGVEMTRGRPGPNFDVYTVRKGEHSLVMIYTGPSSQFPIYSGDTVEAGGRVSVIVVENGQRHAMEHLFQRATAPREIHIWVASVEAENAALAERIAQSVDPR